MAQLRDLPGVDALLGAPAIESLVRDLGAQSVKAVIRELQTEVRASGAMPDWAADPESYAARIESRLKPHTYRTVFNLTGTIIHTNLGRALLSDALWDAVRPLATRPMNLEYDLDEGRRGDRDLVVESRLARLTGCEAATIVNNNAAALMLALNTFALGREVPVSRGELIEIGGSFRLPELMERAGCTLLEVGTTNRTHLRDFEGVVDRASMLLKVHPSNYHIGGFSTEVAASDIARLASEHGIPSCVDLGSGTLIDLTRWGLPHEPTPQSVLDDGVDLVTFSGDKLLGSVQAGIIVGSKPLLDEIKKNPMKRALRADKITLGLLDATLKLYENPSELAARLPLLTTLTLDEAELNKRAEAVQAALPIAWSPEIEAAEAQIGSGALPDKTIPSVAVTLGDERAVDRLRNLATPIIGRVHDGKVWLDMRGADPIDELVAVLGGLT